MQDIKIDTVSIPFDPRWNNIALSLSGGADSALLAYILCSHMSPGATLHCISHTRMWKTRPWQAWDSLTVYNWLKKKFPNTIFQRHTNFIAPELEYGNIGPSLFDEYGKSVSGDNIEIRAFAEYICHWYDIDAYYNAVTRNPKDVSFVGLPERDVDPNEGNQHLRIMKHNDIWAVHPFRFLQKDWIVKQYLQLDIMNLFSLTRSCEGEFLDLDYTTYVPGQYVPACGKCFWCREREWAVEQASK